MGAAVLAFSLVVRAIRHGGFDIDKTVRREATESGCGPRSQEPGRAGEGQVLAGD